MAVEITAPELAGALTALGVSAPGLSQLELAECLLVDAIATRLHREEQAAIAQGLAAAVETNARVLSTVTCRKRKDVT